MRLKNKYKKTGRTFGIILTYNCASMLLNTYKRIPKNVLDQIIICDDGSTDGIDKIARKLPVDFFTHEHRGYGGNIKYGLKKALELGGEYMVEIHGDGQYDPSVIPQALKKIKDGYAFVSGSRFTYLKQALEDKMSLIRYAANLFLSFFDRIVLQVPLTEFHSGFRIYSRYLIETVGFKNTSNNYVYSFEVIAQASFYNLPIAEIPVRCDYVGIHTSISMKKSIVYALETFKVLCLYVLAKHGLKKGVFAR